MANEILVKQGTTKVWTSSGGDYAITLTSLANNAGRIGAVCDRGAAHSLRMRFWLQVDFVTSNPTKGTTVDLYLITSDDNTNWDGGTAPTDSALGSVDTLPQYVYVGSLVLDDLLTPNQSASFEIELGARYIAPVVYNNGTGQALTGTGTDQIIRMTPIIPEIQ